MKTDLSGIDSSEREAYAAALGEEGLDGALRIRDRLGFAGEGEPRRVPLPPLLRAWGP